MNIEFNPKFNSKIDGLTVASGIKRSNLGPNGLNEGSICFKDLLDQTKNGKNQLPMQQAVLSVENPRELMPNEKLTGKEIDENSKDKFKEISENNLMSLLQSSQTILLTPMNNTQTSINFGSGNLGSNNGIDDVSQLTSQLVENTNNSSQVDQLLVRKDESDQKIKSLGIEGENSSVLNTGTKSFETIIVEVAPTLSAKTETDLKVIGSEDQKGVTQTEMEEVTLLNTIPVKNAEIQTIDKVDLSAQIEKEIIFQLDKNKPMTFQMKLDPENLGEIDVQLKFEQGKLVIDIMAFSKETQALLLGQIDKLIKNLALQNVQVESVNLNWNCQYQFSQKQQGF